MKPHLIEIKDSETKNSFYIDMEGPYHTKNTRIGEHIYGITLLIDNLPYHFEKYIPTREEKRYSPAEIIRITYRSLKLTITNKIWVG